MTWEVWGLILTTVIGGTGYLVKKYVDWKVERALAGQLDVLRKRHIERFDAIVRLQGMLAEIRHCMFHLKDDHNDYSEKCNEWCMKVRKEARASIALIGDDLVGGITEATDAALQYSENRSPEVFESWTARLLIVNRAADSTMKLVK